MRIDLISHASLLVTTNGRRFLTDPWYFGAIYNGSWELCPPPPRLPDVRGLDALFLSHAHPDHFEPRSLEWLRDRTGADLPVFVAKFVFDGLSSELRKLGFRNVIEMLPGRRFAPFPGIEFYSQQFRLDDSLLVIRGDATLVNLNDTPIRGAALEDLVRRYPDPHYVAAQFAIAQGYPYSYEGAAEVDFTADDLIARFDRFAAILRPRHMIPFASFVRFCARDNQHMNRFRTTVDTLRARSQSALTILYPGDAIDGDTVLSRPEHRAGYQNDQLSTHTLPDPPRVPLPELARLLGGFLKRLRRCPWILRRRFPAVEIVLSDLNAAIRLGQDGWNSVAVDETTSAPIRYVMRSDMLAEALAHPWGWEDLSIGARFRARVLPGYDRQEVFFWLIPMLLGAGYLDWRTCWYLRPRTWRILWGRRQEIADYLGALVRGRFVSNVVRKKTGAIKERPPASGSAVY